MKRMLGNARGELAELIRASPEFVQITTGLLFSTTLGKTGVELGTRSFLELVVLLHGIAPGVHVRTDAGVGFDGRHVGVVVFDRKQGSKS